MDKPQIQVTCKLKDIPEDVSHHLEVNGDSVSPASDNPTEKLGNMNDKARITFAAIGKADNNPTKDTDASSEHSSFTHHYFHYPHFHIHHPHFHLWNSNKLPHRSTEAHALARAEAASWAQMSPLIAATLGPLAVLLGIPCLTQRWHGQLLSPPVLDNGSANFMDLPDPKLNLILAGITLMCEVLGNLCLVMRFSNFHSKLMTWTSYSFWIAKTLLGIGNYIQFGVTHRLNDEIIYLQGFWVGVCSMGVTVIILMALTFNLSFLHGQDAIETRRLHHVQREFMVQTLLFFFFLGIYALIFSKVEDSVTYVDGIYFAVVTTLTIGFGDITPKTATMKVLVFPCTIAGIGLLAVIVTSIVRLLSDRARRRKLRLKKRLKEKTSEKEKERRRKSRAGEVEGPRLKRTLTLQAELHELRDQDWKRERKANIRNMILGLSGFFIFWFFGALIFHYVESWGYGNALYFCYIFFLTIGFGDFYPITQAGRPVFLVYALLAVPTMTIIVQTVTSNFAAYTMQRLHRQRHQVYKEKDFEIESLNSLVRQAKAKTLERADPDILPETKLPIHDVPERLMESLQQMHHHLQNLLMQNLGSDARNVITAERHRQASVDKERLKRLEEGREEGSVMPGHLSEIGQVHGKDELELLNEYRKHYANIVAELLVAKERLLELENSLQDDAPSELWKRRISEDIEELKESPFDCNIRPWRRRSSEM